MEIPAGFEPVDEGETETRLASVPEGFITIEDELDSSAGEMKQPTQFGGLLIQPGQVLEEIPAGFEPVAPTVDTPPMEDSWGVAARKWGSLMGNEVTALAPRLIKMFTEVAADPTTAVLGMMGQAQQGAIGSMLDLAPVPLSAAQKDRFTKFVAEKTLQSEWIKRVGQNTWQSIGTQLLGAEGVDALTDANLAKMRAAEDELKILAEMQQDNAVVADMWSPKGIFTMVAKSAPSTLMGIGAGVVAGPAAGLGVMSTTVAAEQYVDSRSRLGRDVGESLADAIVMGAAETVGEVGVLKELMKTGVPLLQKIGITALSEAGQEMVTETLQTAYSMDVLGEDMTLKEAAMQVLYAGVVGGVSGALLAPGFHGVERAQTAMEIRRIMREKEHLEKRFVIPEDEAVMERDLYWKNAPVGAQLLTPREQMHYIQLEMLNSLITNRLEQLGPEPRLISALADVTSQLTGLRKKVDVLKDKEGQLTLPGFGISVDVADNAEKFGNESLTYAEYLKKKQNEEQQKLWEIGLPKLDDRYTKYRQELDKLRQDDTEYAETLKETPEVDTYFSYPSVENVRNLLNSIGYVKYAQMLSKKLNKIFDSMGQKEYVTVYVSRDANTDTNTVIGSLNPNNELLGATFSQLGENKKVNVLRVPRDAFLAMGNDSLSSGSFLIDTAKSKYVGWYAFDKAKILEGDSFLSDERTPDDLRGITTADGKFGSPDLGGGQETMFGNTERAPGVNTEPEQLGFDAGVMGLQDDMFRGPTPIMPELPPLTIDEKVADVDLAMDEIDTLFTSPGPVGYVREGRRKLEDVLKQRSLGLMDILKLISGGTYNYSNGKLVSKDPKKTKGGNPLDEMLAEGEMLETYVDDIQRFVVAKHQQLFEEAEAFLKQLVSVYLGRARVVVNHTYNSKFFGQMAPVGMGRGNVPVVVMTLDWRAMLSDPKTAYVQVMDTIAHEVAHATQFLYWDSASDAMKNKILEKYTLWYMEHANKDLPEAARTGLSALQAEQLFNYASNWGMTNLALKDFAPEKSRLYFSFVEWFAQQTSRHMLTLTERSKYEARANTAGTLGSFFANIASQIRGIYKKLEKKLGYTSETHFQDWVESWLQQAKEISSGNTALAWVAPAKFYQWPDANGLGGIQFSSSGNELAAVYRPLEFATEQVSNIVSRVKAVIPGWGKVQQGMDRYNKFIHQGFNILHLMEANKHIRGLVDYVDEVQQWHHITKMPWVSRADEITKHWQALGAQQGDALSKLMFKLTTAYDAWPTQEQFINELKTHGITLEGLAVYNELRQYFRDYLSAFEEVQVANVLTAITDPALAGQEVAAIRADYAKMKAKPYFPLSRFGEYTIVVRGADGKVVHMEAFESKGSRDRNFLRVQQEHPGMLVRKDKIAEENTVFRYLPPQFAQRLLQQLKLTAEQQNALEQMLYQYVPGASFRHHFDKRQEIGGWNEDGLRTFANYALHGANHLARAKHLDRLKEAIASIDEGLRVARKIGTGDLTTRVEIKDYLNRHLEYIMNPPNEFAALRSIGFLWFMGFNVKSAVVNLTQTPFVTMPHLGAVFGQGPAALAFTKALTDLRKMYRSPDWKPDDSLMKALDMGIRQGFLNESQATELAGVSEGSLLARLKGATPLARKFLTLNQWAAYPMQVTEMLNRRFAFRAAWELALKDPENPYVKESAEIGRRLYDELVGLHGFSPIEAMAFLTARRVVMKTQFEYSSYARPEMMRGWKAPVLQFYQYTINMLWNFKNTEGGKTMLLMYLLAGGLMGLPFAKDIEALVQWLARFLFKEEADLEKELREVLVALGSEKPDLWVHGASRYGFGLGTVANMMGVPFPEFDLSGSMSFGNIIPGVSALESPGEFNSKFYQASTDVVGAVFGAGLGMLEAINSDNPDEFKRWERAMPAALRNISRAYRWSEEGREKTNNGATVVEFRTTDPEEVGEIVGQALGFAPTRLAQQWDARRAQQERINFYKMRRTHLLQFLNHARLNRDKDSIQEARQKIREYNSNLPHSGLKITSEVMQRSWKATAGRRRKAEMNIPYEKAYRGLARETRELYPEVK